MTLPPAVQEAVSKLTQSIKIPLPGGFEFSPNLLQAGLIVLLLFFLVYTIGHVRHTYVDWSWKGIMPGLSFGFILAIILEGLFLVGGKTLFTEVLQWQDAPKPISTVVNAGRDKLTDVLGVTEQVPVSNAQEQPTAKSVMHSIDNLELEERDKLQNLFCIVK